MARNSGMHMLTCKFCGKRYVRTNFMIRRYATDQNGMPLGDTHQIACYRKVLEQQPLKPNKKDPSCITGTDQ